MVVSVVICVLKILSVMNNLSVCEKKNLKFFVIVGFVGIMILIMSKVSIVVIFYRLILSLNL